MDTYIQGESIELTIPVVDGDGAAVDLSGVDTITVEVYHRSNKTTLKSGTYAGGEVTSADLTTGIILIHIEDDLTTVAAAGIYNYLVTLTQTDAGFDDDTNTSMAKNNAFEIVRK
jgi:hypothetical protein